MQNRQLLRHKLRIQKIDTGQIVARPSDGCDKTQSDGIFRDNKDDRDRCGCRLCGQYDGSTSTRIDDGDLPANQLRRQFLHSLDFIICPAIEDFYVVVFHITGISEALTKTS